MRGLALIVATSLLVVACAPFLVLPVRAQEPPLTRMAVTIGVDPAGRLVFAPTAIRIPEVNITLNVTFRNNYTEAGAQDHTFTVRNSDGVIVIDTGLVPPNGTASVEFHIVSLTNISYNGTSFQPQPLGSGIRFFCVPHEGAGMEGSIVLTTLAAESPEKGSLLRAYWIGIIGIAATLVWTGISYFLIKSSSRHFTDHREHVRKGLP